MVAYYYRLTFKIIRWHKRPKFVDADGGHNNDNIFFVFAMYIQIWNGFRIQCLKVNIINFNIFSNAILPMLQGYNLISCTNWEKISSPQKSKQNSNTSLDIQYDFT